MSMHSQHVPDAEQEPHNHPEIAPSIYFSFIADTSQVVQNACTCLYFDDGMLPGSGPADPLVRAQDAEDFLDKWINKELYPADKHQPIRGYWIIQDWEAIGQDAVVITRYKTFQICARAGPRARKIIISSADVADLVSWLLEGVSGDEEMAPFIVHAVCNGQPFQWLIVTAPQSVVQDPTSGSAVVTAETGGQACVAIWQVRTTRDTFVVNYKTVLIIHGLHESPEWGAWYEGVEESSRLLFGSAERRIQELEGSQMAVDGETEDCGGGVEDLQWLSIS